MDNLIEKTAAAVKFLTEKNFQQATAAVVMGTGLGALVERMQVEAAIPYQDIPHFAVSTVEFHKGNLLLGTIGKTKLIVMQGRFHYYEGYSMQQVTFPIRVLKALGVQQLFLSNAAGGMNPGFKKGDLVLINDHINMQPDNPLRGVNDPALGNRFVDMSMPYNPGLCALLQKTAAQLNLSLKEGVYVAVGGPNLETRAEYRFLRAAGADMVGMSTVPEVIVANQVELPCAAISIITDECDPDNLHVVSIADIIQVAAAADKKLAALLHAVFNQ